jgi:hypothetical protein
VESGRTEEEKWKKVLAALLEEQAIEGDALRARRVEGVHSPGTAIALDSDQRMDRRTLGHGAPHESMQPHPSDM